MTEIPAAYPDRMWLDALRLLVRLAAYSVAAVIVGFAGLRLFHLDGWFPITILSAGAPVFFLLSYPLLVAAGWRRHGRLALAALVGVAFHLWWFGAMLPVVHSHRALPDGATRVRVLSANLLAGNTRAVDLAGTIEKTSPDVVAFQEYTYKTGIPLGDSAALKSYQYRIVDPAGGPEGIALFSRLPFGAEEKLVLGGRKALRAQVLTAAGPVTVVVAHTVAPLDPAGNQAWAEQLAAIGDLAREIAGPLIVAADLNATPGNRQLADLVNRGHIRDVLDATGSGYAMTWPANRGPIPPNVRPDHILVGRGVVPLDGRTLENPGSDHRAVLADVGVSRPH